MGVMDKFLHAMNFYEAEEEYDNDEDYYDEGEIIDNTVRTNSEEEPTDDHSCLF